MTFGQSILVIREHLDRMNALYEKSIFDEWAVIVVEGAKGRILAYEGERREDFAGSFPTDIEAFGTDLIETPHEPGGYFFSRHATGTHFDAYLALGGGSFLICNNTSQSMTGITQNPLWLKAQIPFVELSERFRADPLVLPA